MVELVSEQQSQPSPAAEAAPGTALVVVVSPATVRAVEELAAAGWSGPVLMVATVDEAQQIVGVPTLAAPAPEHGQESGRRSGGGDHPHPPDTPVTGIRLDPDRQLLVSGDRDCALTPLEYGVLERLCEEPGRVRRFTDLTRRVWGVAYVGDGAAVHAVIRRVRRKLELVRAPVQILAVRGIGFRLVVHDPSERRRLALAD